MWMSIDMDKAANYGGAGCHWLYGHSSGGLCGHGFNGDGICGYGYAYKLHYGYSNEPPRIGKQDSNRQELLRTKGGELSWMVAAEIGSTAMAAIGYTDMTVNPRSGSTFTAAYVSTDMAANHHRLLGMLLRGLLPLVL